MHRRSCLGVPNPIWVPAFVFLFVSYSCPIEAQKICQDIPLNKPRVTANFSSTSCQQRIQWFDCALRYYGISREHIRIAAETKSVPMRLLATVIANELMDYGNVDITQERKFTGAGSSAGIAQLQPIRLVKHKLIEPPMIRPPDLGFDSPPVVDYVAIWKRLIRPIDALEFAAREIDWILTALSVANRDGYELPSFYLMPGGMIRADDPYRDVKPLTLYPGLVQGHDDSSVQVRKEGALAHAVGVAYNNGALSQGEHVIWNWDSRSQGDPLLSSATGGVSHGANARGYWASCFAEKGWPNERQESEIKEEVDPLKGYKVSDCRWFPRSRDKGTGRPNNYQCRCVLRRRDSSGIVIKEKRWLHGATAQQYCPKR